MTLPKRAIPGAPVPSLADLYDHAPVGYITVSTEGVVLAVNDTLLKWTGRLRHELVGHSWVEVLLTHAGQTFFSTHIEPLLRLQGYARELSLDLQCADNTRMATLVYIDRKDHIADVPVFWLTVVEATDRRRYETKLVEARRSAEDASQALRELTADLEKRVSERTAALRSAHDELDAFSYAVQHDLRAPLRVLDGYVDLLGLDLAPSLPPQARAYLDQVSRCSRQMIAMIDGLFQLSVSTRGEPERADFDVSARSVAVLEDLTKVEPQRQVTWYVEPELRVWADPRMMESVLRNLLGNAWKYSARNAAARIEVRSTVEEGKRYIAVADNGVGFNAEQAKRLFRPFQRLHSEKEFPGTGIGLSTVQRIVQRHGGTIEAIAGAGGGAVFRFWLPDAERDSARAPV